MTRIDPLLVFVGVDILFLTNICIVQNIDESHMTMIDHMTQVRLYVQTIFLDTTYEKNAFSFLTPWVVCWNIHKQIYQ
jgi:hypothetical protein